MPLGDNALSSNMLKLSTAISRHIFLISLAASVMATPDALSPKRQTESQHCDNG